MKTKYFLFVLLLMVACTKDNQKNSGVINSGSEENARKKFHIGDSLGGGIIFYLDSTGKHGMIAAPADIGQFTWWNVLAEGCGDQINGKHFINTRTVATAIGSGASNTTKIISKQGNTGSYAAKACRDYRGGGFSDWFLPSLDELLALENQAAIVGGFGPYNYWTSTEFHSTDFGNCEHYAYEVYFLFHAYAYTGKFDPDFYVRPVRNF